MKNCGEYVQFEVAEQHVLQEMVKIIQKKVSLLPSFFMHISFPKFAHQRIFFMIGFLALSVLSRIVSVCLFNRIS